MPGLDGKVKIPGDGMISKKAAAAGLAVTGVLIIIYFRGRNKAAAAAAPAAAGQYPPDGTTGDPSDPYSTDPATGQTYGNESAGSGGTFGAFPAGTSGAVTDTATPAGPYITPGGPPFSSNSAWSDWVIQELPAANPAVDIAALTDAIGLYLAGQSPSAAQHVLIFDAIAVAGNPPVAGPGGYPPKIRAAAGRPGPGHAAAVTVPDVTGDRVSNAIEVLKAHHLTGKHPVRKTGTAYVVTGQSPAAGRRVPEGSIVTLQISPEGRPHPSPDRKVRL